MEIEYHNAMLIPYEYAYLFGTLLFGSFWVAFFLIKKSVRREMLILSFGSLLLGLTQIIYTHDYWHPLSVWGNGRIDVESFLLSFFYGGIAAAAYEILFWKKPNYSSKPGNLVQSVIAAVVAIGCLILGVYVLNWNSLYVSSSVLLILGVMTLVARLTLLKHALVTGIVFTCITLFCLEVMTLVFPGVIEMMWKLENLSGIYILDIPLEEALFAFSWGFFIGPVSELAARVKLKLL